MVRIRDSDGFFKAFFKVFGATIGVVFKIVLPCVLGLILSFFIIACVISCFQYLIKRTKKETPEYKDLEKGSEDASPAVDEQTRVQIEMDILNEMLKARRERTEKLVESWGVYIVSFSRYRYADWYKKSTYCNIDSVSYDWGGSRRLELAQRLNRHYTWPWISIFLYLNSKIITWLIDESTYSMNRVYFLEIAYLYVTRLAPY